MSLAKRRATNQFQADEYPALKRRIDEVAGFELDVDVNWDSITGQIGFDPERFSEHFRLLFVEPLVAAIAEVASDDLGRDALREGLAKVAFVAEDDGHYGTISMDASVLTIDHKFINVDRTEPRQVAIREALEAAL